MYRALPYPVAAALLVAALWQNAFYAPRIFAADQPDAPLPDITAQQLADDVRKQLDRYSAAYLEAEFDEERSPKSFGIEQDGLPEILRWSGSMRYAGDGRRWRAELDSKSIALTEGQPGGQRRAHLFPSRDIAGFDGERHYMSHGFGGWAVGEDNPVLARQCPTDLFWSSLNGSELFLSTLADPKTSILGQELRGGFRCYLAEHAAPNIGWRQRIVVSPRQSHLAVHVEQLSGDVLVWSHDLDDVRLGTNGRWYPRHIVLDSRTVNNEGVSEPFIRRELHVTAFDPNREFSDVDFELQPSFGQPVRDYTTGKSWFNDPWWPDIEPALAKHGWPQQDLTPLNDFASRVVSELEDRPAPVLTAARWINTKAIEWQQLAGQVVVVHFFDGRLTLPTPRQLAALRRLHELYFPAGLEIVAIAPSTVRPDRVEQLATELDLRFPIAVDAPAEAGLGKTFSAFRLNTYPQTFLVDSEGKLHHLENGELMAAIHSMLKKAGAEDLPQLDTQNRPRIPAQAVREVAAVWPEMVRRAPHAGRISGRITDGDRAIAGAEAVAKLHLLVLSTPSAMQTVTTPFEADNDFRASSDADGAYELGGLPKGIYEVTFAVPGKARVERQVIIKPDLAAETLDVVLDQDDGIAGRVVDDEGRPVAGARVHPRDWHFDRENLGVYKRGLLPVDDTVTNEHGEFYLQGLYQGAWSCDVTAEGFEKGELTHVPSGTAGHVVKLKRAKVVKP